MTEPKPRRQRRTKANIIECLDNAAVNEISQRGFASSLVTNLIRSAKIEPQVFYNRYRDINEFFDTFVKRYDNGLDSIISIFDPSVSDPKSWMAGFLIQALKSVNDDPVALELLRWELSDKCRTTMRTSLLREMNLQPIIKSLEKSFSPGGIDITAIFCLLIGGVYYLALHRKLAPFHGIDTEAPEGRKRLEDAITRIMELISDCRSRYERECRIAERLRASGVAEETIRFALSSDRNAPPATHSN